MSLTLPRCAHVWWRMLRGMRIICVCESADRKRILKLLVSNIKSDFYIFYSFFLRFFFVFVKVNLTHFEKMLAHSAFAWVRPISYFIFQNNVIKIKDAKYRQAHARRLRNAAKGSENKRFSCLWANYCNYSENMSNKIQIFHQKE